MMAKRMFEAVCSPLRYLYSYLVWNTIEGSVDEAVDDLGKMCKGCKNKRKCGYDFNSSSDYLAAADLGSFERTKFSNELYAQLAARSRELRQLGSTILNAEIGSEIGEKLAVCGDAMLSRAPQSKARIEEVIRDLKKKSFHAEQHRAKFEGLIE